MRQTLYFHPIQKAPTLPSARKAMQRVLAARMSSAEFNPKAPSRAFTVALGLIALITPLAVHLFFPVIPAVKVALGLSDARAQLTFSIALFGMAFATLFYGSLSDRYGRRPVLLSGLALFLFGSVVSLMAETANALVLGRLVQAIGAGCALTLGSRDRARRLSRRATRQGDCLSDDVRHAWADGLAIHRRRADRYARLAQRVRLRARGRRRHHVHGVSGDG